MSRMKEGNEDGKEETDMEKLSVDNDISTPVQ